MTKREPDIDLDQMTVTCPAGHTTAEHSMVKGAGGGSGPVASFKFPKETCQQCPLREVCNSDARTGRRRTIVLSAYEVELQRTKAFNATPRAKQVLRSRSAIERLIGRMGMRHARFFGMQLTQYQAYLTTAAYNLQRIFTLTKWSTA